MKKLQRQESAVAALALDPIPLNIGNICRGKLPAHFDRAMLKIMESVRDIDTPADAIRRIEFRFDFVPSMDRKSATVSMSYKLKMPAPASSSGEVFFTENDILAEDPRQEALPLHGEADAKTQ